MLKIFSENNLKKFIYFIVILIAFTPTVFSNQTIFPYVTSKMIALRILISLLIGSYLILISKSKEYLPKKSNVLKWFFGFIVVAFITGMLSKDPSQSFWSNPERFMGVYNYLYFFCFMLITSSVIKAKKE